MIYRTLTLVAETTFTSGNLTARENLNSNNIFYALYVVFCQSQNKHIRSQCTLSLPPENIRKPCGKLNALYRLRWKLYQQDPIKRSYFRNQCFDISTTCCATKSPNNNVRNDVIAVTESSNHDRVPSFSCLQKFVHKI